MRKFRLLPIGVAVLMVTFIACKKNVAPIDEKVVGRWQRIPMNVTSPILQLSKNKQFVYAYSGLAYGGVSRGIYSINSDSLKLVTTPDSIQRGGSILYKDAVFTVVGNLLTIKYPSNQADSIMKFQRIK